MSNSQKQPIRNHLAAGLARRVGGGKRAEQAPRLNGLVSRLIDGVRQLPGRVHRDERGTISIATVFAIFMFTLLLAMVMNVARHADDKIRMQNAADAAAYTGSTVISRGMNSLAFTNHLLCEVFALTAYMREGEARSGDEFVPEILAEWHKVGQVFENSGSAAGIPKFERMGRAIQAKVPLEQAVVDAFSEMAQEHSRMTLPVLEYILRGPNAPPADPPVPDADPEGGFIPRFQRAVVQMTPALAQLAANEIARRHGERVERQHEDLPLQAVIWRTDVMQIDQADEANPFERTLPVLDPSPGGPDTPLGGVRSLYPRDPNAPPGPPNPLTFLEIAQGQRERLAKYYLEEWIRDWMGPYFDFDGGRDGMTTAKMSNFINLWRIFTCGHLEQLLDEEYPETNVPHIIREMPDAKLDSGDPGNNPFLESKYTFVTVVYWPHLQETFPGLFRNMLSGDGQSDALTFAQTTVLIPRARLRYPWWTYGTNFWGGETGPFLNSDNWPNRSGGFPIFQTPRWDLFNQIWTAKPVPTTSPSIVQILQSNPGGSVGGFRPPDLGGATMDDIRSINMH